MDEDMDEDMDETYIPNYEEGEDMDEDMYEDMDEDMDEEKEDLMDMDMDERKSHNKQDKFKKIFNPDPTPQFPEPDMDFEEGKEKDMDEDYMDEEIDLEEILNELETEEDDSKKEEEVLDEMGKPVYKADYVQSQHMYKADDVMENKEFDLDTLLEEINSLDKKTKPSKVQRKAPKIRTLTPAKTLNERKRYGCREASQNLVKVEKELNEITSAYKKVKNELNEVNLLNSKLLYVNRIFKANQLDDPQKLRVVETLDKAESIKEAKLIYETIKDSFSISTEALEKEIQKEVKNSVKKSSSKKHIRENLGMASKATGMSRTKKVAPKRAVINESDNMVSRFQKLANIKISE